MSHFARIAHRLQSGRPLVVDSDSAASLRARGLGLNSPGAAGLLLREHPDAVRRHYAAEVASCVDVLCALTADTTPRALAEVGMEHRSAWLTGTSVELALEEASAAPKPVAVAGVLGSDMVSPLSTARLVTEFQEHANRLASSGCELIIARGQGSRLGLMAAVVAGAETSLPTWAVLQLHNDEVLEGDVEELLQTLTGAGASAVVLEVSGTQAGLDYLERLKSTSVAPLGVLMAAGAQSVRGFADEAGDLRAWAARVLALTSPVCRIIGGGAGTTEAHTRSLAVSLGSLPPPALHAHAPLDGQSA
ncbi:MAG: homocysteine S-methyltransferase family protein [Polyangiaceae bacterium]|nr:homocysteine S-methyltransferase family protein [Polyangiaceae bacterium]